MIWEDFLWSKQGVNYRVYGAKQDPGFMTALGDDI